MKKRLLSAAVLLAVGGAAQAQVSIYGLVDMSYGKSFVTDLAGDKAQFHSGGDNSSSEGNSTTRVGIKGAYDLGGGVKANFRFETSGIQSDGDKNGALFGRQAWFGLSGGFGEFRVGRQDSVAFQTMIDFDFNGASNGVSAGAYTGIGAFAVPRQSGVLQYISPTVSGLTAQIGYQPKGNAGGDKDVGSLGVKYAAGAFAAAVSYQSKGDSTEKDFTSVAASYDFGVAKVMASYASGQDFSWGGKGKGYVLGVTAPVAGFNVGAHYGENTEDSKKIKSIEVFVNKEIYKNTYAYFEAGNWKVNSGSALGLSLPKNKLDAYAAGLIFVF
jgi:predicted porin